METDMEIDMSNLAPPDEKYIVFKKDEFQEWFETAANDSVPFPIPNPVPDAVVIRRQDVFAPPALDCYANSISVALELFPTDADDHLHDYLQSVADYFHLNATASWAIDRKLPD